MYALATLLEKRGWGVFTGQKPKHMSIPVGEQTAALLPQLIADMHECVGQLEREPDTKPEGNAAVYGAAANLPDEVLDGILRGYVDIKLKVKPKNIDAQT